MPWKLNAINTIPGTPHASHGVKAQHCHGLFWIKTSGDHDFFVADRFKWGLTCSISSDTHGYCGKSPGLSSLFPWKTTQNSHFWPMFGGNPATQVPPTSIEPSTQTFQQREGLGEPEEPPMLLGIYLRMSCWYYGIPLKSPNPPFTAVV